MEPVQSFLSENNISAKWRQRELPENTQWNHIWENSLRKTTILLVIPGAEDSAFIQNFL